VARALSFVLAGDFAEQKPRFKERCLAKRNLATREKKYQERG
jgi:hypothetical protein